MTSQRRGPLFTDLYELTMAAAYHAHGMTPLATFSLFLRAHERRGYFVAAGLETVLEELACFRVTKEEMAYLKSLGIFKSAFLSYLESIAFSGRISAMPEGTLFFPEEPILEVTAPLIEAQLVETLILNTIGASTLLASKTARCVHAAKGRQVVDFSLRRTQGSDAGMTVARSAYMTGFTATSNVLAGEKLGIPVAGTMAHSFVQAFESETAAFRAYARVFPEKSIFLIDTYDTLDGARNAVTVAHEMEKQGHRLLGIRLDSGDMVDLSKKVRKILDDAGLSYVRIFASSGFDEYKIAEALSGGAAIDAFGVGTYMGVSADAPYLDIVYKLVRVGPHDVRKLSPGKTTLAGEKQIFRAYDENGGMAGDVIGCRDEVVPGSVPLLETVMESGKRAGASPSLDTIRDHFQTGFSALGKSYKDLRRPGQYPVKISSALDKLQEGCT